MPLLTTKYQSDIEKLFDDAAKKAFLATYDVPVSDRETTESVKTKIAAEFGKVFGKELASSLAKVTEEYIKSATLQHVLVAPNGPVTGLITVT